MSRDPRLLLKRETLAASELQGVERAQSYADPTPMQVVAPAASLRAAADANAEQIDQLLLGERFDVLETRNGFAWGQARRDGYVGHVAVGALSKEISSPTHWVSALRTYAHAQPVIRSAATGPFSLNSLVTVTEESAAFAFADQVGWLPKIHLMSVGRTRDDPAAVVESLLGAPYLWGGRDSLGLDCSGLIQQALYACGRSCPRDADQQQALGSRAERSDLRRGDLVFWKGHVGMMMDAERLAHANAHHMAVAIEPLARAVTRIRASGGGGPTAYRRL